MNPLTKNYIQLTYVDDNGMDHHVRKSKVPPYKAPCPAQTEMVYILAGDLAEKMREFLEKKGCGKLWNNEIGED